MQTKPCPHFDQIEDATPSARGCTECLAVGDTWVNLRMCLICGNVGCCDDSKNTHATKHYHASDHPVMKSFQPDEDWMYCYVDKISV